MPKKEAPAKKAAAAKTAKPAAAKAPAKRASKAKGSTLESVEEIVSEAGAAVDLIAEDADQATGLIDLPTDALVIKTIPINRTFSGVTSARPSAPATSDR